MPRIRWTTFSSATLALLLFACAGPPAREGAAPGPPPSRRIVALGDLHGDFDAAQRALRMAGAIDEAGHWAGGDMVLVQTGDILDRGDGERAILELFERLGEEARREGGEVRVLNANHELMNVYQDFRYTTDGGFAAFADVPVPEPPDSLLASFPPSQRGRVAAFRPGGPFALLLAEHPVATIVGGTLFVHGGILPEHLSIGLDEMNRRLAAWLKGEAPMPEWVRGERSPVWARLYSASPSQAACDTLQIVLDSLKVERMVVGHTVQGGGITAYCGGRVWCIDVGMAAHYGGRPEVLEIRGEAVGGIR